MNKRPVTQVFSASCPCTHHVTLSQQEIIEKTWHLTSRISSQNCLNQVIQVFCAIHDDTDPNDCIPSTSHLYPTRGKRPKFLWEDLEKWQRNPHKVSVFLVFKKS